MHAPTPRLVPMATAVLVLLLLAATPCRAGDADPLAAEGYDVVAYFDDDEAVKGSSTHALSWNGKTWRFANAEHLRMFREDPQRYAPAYDGHCAWALAGGSLANGRPVFWAIHEGRLFFNCNRKVHERWLADREWMVEAADAEWAERKGD